MNLVCGHPTFTGAVIQMLPEEFKHHPYNVRTLDKAEQHTKLFERFNHGKIATFAVDAPDYEIAQVTGEGEYGYVLTIFDKRDMPVGFYSCPDV